MREAKLLESALEGSPESGKTKKYVPTTAKSRALQWNVSAAVCVASEYSEPM